MRKLLLVICAVMLIATLVSAQPLASAASDPYLVHGTVYYGGSVRAGATVSIKDKTTGESIITSTNGDGYYQDNLLNLPSAWSDGDQITVAAYYGTGFASTSITASEGDSGHGVDLYIITGSGSGGTDVDITFMTTIRVVDSSTSDPVAGASVRLYSESADDTQLSDTNGEAQLTVADAQNHLIVEKAGYQRYTKTFSSGAELIDNVNTVRISKSGASSTPNNNLYDTPGFEVAFLAAAFLVAVIMISYRRGAKPGSMLMVVSSLALAGMMLAPVSFTFNAAGIPVETYEIDLASGWNLISFPLSGTYIGETEIDNASALCTAIDLGGTQVIAKIDGDYYTYIDGVSVDDIEFTDGMGMYVWVSDSKELDTIGGIYDGTEVTLSPGWNLIGTSFEMPASWYVDRFNDLTSIVGRDSGGLYTSYEHGVTHSDYDFNVSMGSGYYVFSPAGGIISLTVDGASDMLALSDFSGGTGSNVSYSSIELDVKSDWWNTSWEYRVPISVGFDHNSTDITLETELNFTDLMEEIGIGETIIDVDSVRVVERGVSGMLVLYNLSETGDARYVLPCGITESSGYDEDDNAVVNLEWLVPGDSVASEVRDFEIYLNVEDHLDVANPSIAVEYPEIIYANSEGGVPISWLYWNSNGTPDCSSTTYFGGGPMEGVTVADLNSDGYKEVIYGRYMNVNSYNTVSQAFNGSHDGIDNSTSTNFTTIGSYGSAVGDLNNDGYQDIIFTSYRNLSNYNVSSPVYLGGPNGFNNTPDYRFKVFAPSDVVIADLNGDGWNDVIFSSSKNSTSYNVYSPIFYGSPSGFNGTSMDDLYLGQYFEKVYSNKTGDILFPTNSSKGVAVADLNKDGCLDLVFSRNSKDSGTGFCTTSPVYYGGLTGFNNSTDGDVDLVTDGATDVEIADLNSDGWLDVVFSCYVNDSVAYYGSPSGFNSSLPDVTFNTTWAQGVSVGDVNLDGNLDVAFAEYYSGVSYDVNSDIFYGPFSSTEITADVLLRTIGGFCVRIADLGVYSMETDRNSPIITPGDMESYYYGDGIYTSEGFSSTGDILYANITWNASIPELPLGCDITVYLSNDGGAHWQEATAGRQLTFTHAGNTLQFRIELVSDSGNTSTPVFSDIQIYWVCTKQHNL